MICVCISFQINAGFGTLNTNFSPLRTAMVSKCPSQMSGPCSGLGTLVGRGGGGGGGAPDLVPAVGGMFVGEVTSLEGYSTEIILQCHWRVILDLTEGGHHCCTCGTISLIQPM